MLVVKSSFLVKTFPGPGKQGDMGLQYRGQTINFLNEAEGMNCKIIVRHTLTDNVVPAALNYPSQNLCEIPCIICTSHWMDWGAKNLDAILSVTVMKDILFYSTASVSDAGGDQLSLWLGMSKKMENVGSRQAQNTSDKNRKMFSQVILWVERKTKTWRSRCDWV